MTQAQPPEVASDHSFTDNFDGDVIEPVRVLDPATSRRGPSEDIRFSRADMNYWEEWGLNLRRKREAETIAELNKKIGMEPVAYMRALAEIKRRDVQIFELIDMQFYPAGIKKILNDALLRGGMADGNRRAAVLRSIAPRRQQELAAEICSEPQATIEQLRESYREVLLRIGIAPAQVAKMSDDELVAFGRNYTPTAKPTATPHEPAGGEEAEDQQANPMEPDGAKAASGLTGEAATPSSERSLSSIPVS